MVRGAPDLLLHREHGRGGPWVVTVHGGPGAPGSLAPLARRLARSCRVLEPFERRSGGAPLTVARHVADLHALLRRRIAGERPAIVGHSWGAMLALAYAAEHPEAISCLVLVGCGTFDRAARRSLRETVEARMDDALRRRIERLPQEVADPDEQFRSLGELLLPLYSWDLASTDLELTACDARGFEESWSDMLRLQEAGTYPAAFAAIRLPVLMLHGTTDPHPGPLIRASLAPHLPQLEYRELPRCGHYPWLEKEAREVFFSLLEEWLDRRLG